MFSRLVERRIGAMRATAAAIVDGDMQRRVPTEGDGGAFDAQAHARLVDTNWIRTVCWTARGVIALWMIHRSA